MDKNKKIYMECPLCKGRHAFLPNRRKVDVKIDNKTVTYNEQYFECLFHKGKKKTFIPKMLELENDIDFKNAVSKAEGKKNKKNTSVRFVLVRLPKYKKLENSKWEYEGLQEKTGLLIGDKIYFTPKSSKAEDKVKIVKKYNNIPDWADEWMISEYKKNKKVTK